MHYPTIMFTGLASSIGLILAFRYLGKPGIERRRRQYGEECADTLLGPLESAATSVEAGELKMK